MQILLCPNEVATENKAAKNKRSRVMGLMMQFASVLHTYLSILEERPFGLLPTD